MNSEFSVGTRRPRRRREVFKIKYEAARFWLPEGQEIPVIDSGLMPDPTSSSGAFSYVVEGAEGLAHASAFVLDLKTAA